MASAPVQSRVLHHGLAEDRRAIEDLLSDILSATTGQSSVVHEAMRYAVLGGAQRIRPILSVRVARIFDSESELTLRCAAAVELLHCASLVIDDLPCMDDAAVRRNRASVHVRFGESTAVLAAFGLVALSARSVLDCAVSEAERRRLIGFQIELLQSIDCGGLIAGQALDLELAHKARSRAQAQISELKTVPLFRLAVSAGTLFSDSNIEERTLLNCFGRHFGLAFQMSDDVLDGEEADLIDFEAKLTGLRTALAPLGAAKHGLNELVDYLHARVFPPQSA